MMDIPRRLSEFQIVCLVAVLRRTGKRGDVTLLLPAHRKYIITATNYIIIAVQCKADGTYNNLRNTGMLDYRQILKGMLNHKHLSPTVRSEIQINITQIGNMTLSRNKKGF